MSRSILLLLLLFTTPLFSQVEELPPEGYEFCGLGSDDFEALDLLQNPSKGLISHIEAAPEPGALAKTMLEGGPSAVVGGCVNAISGDFFESEVDFVIPGIEPLAVERSYSSQDRKWHYRHVPRLDVTPSKGGHHITAIYQDDNGFGLQFNEKIHRDNSFIQIPISKKLMQKGLTNCGSGEISGRSNWKNAQVRLLCGYKGKSYFLKTGGNVRRVFDRYEQDYGRGKKGLSFGKFHLVAEYRPTGNHLKYHYSLHAKNELSKITVQNKNGAVLSELCRIHSKQQEIWKSPYQRTAYQKDSDSRLISVSSSERPQVNYTYDSSGNLTGKQLPEGRKLKINYFAHGEHKGKVAALYSPAGDDETLLTTHHFHYEKGRTIVTDCLGAKTVYRFDPETKRLLSVSDGEGRVERFIWASEETPLAGHLIGRKLYSGEQEVFSQAVQYDKFGNIRKETLKGNLTGESISEYTKTYITSQDGLNLTLEENDGQKWIKYAYHPNTNHLTKRLTGTSEKICKREFFKYDVNGATIHKIVDDGEAEEEEDLRGVTERHLELITATQDYPIGLPEVVEERYYDKETDTYPLLKKIIFSYSPQGAVTEEKHYGSDNLLAYRIARSYDSYGNLIQETDPLGNITSYTYDALGNKLSESNPQQQKKFTYDFANRLIKEEEFGPNGEWLTTYHTYDLMGRRLTTIDCDGDKAEFTYDTLGRLASKTLHIGEPCTELYSHDAMGNVATHTDPNGSCTKTTYTVRGQPCQIEYPDGSKETKTYSLDGLLIKEVSKTGLETIYTHDCFGNVIRKQIGDKVTSAHYDSFHLLWEKDEEGVETHYTYDAAGRLIKKTRGDKTTTYTYDTLGREHIITESDKATVKLYDAKGQLIEERVESLEHELLMHKTYAYDFLGNTTLTQVGSYPKESLFTPQGKLLQEKDALGYITSYSYSFAPFKITKIDPNGNREETTYNGREQIVKLETFDPFGKLVQAEERYYDKAGHHICTKAKTLPGHSTQTIEWRYDLMGRVAEIIEAKDTPTQRVTGFTYTITGKKEQVTLPDGISQIYSYDEYDRLIRLTSTDNSIDYRYSYDIKDRLIKEQDAIQGTTTLLSYDIHDRLIEETLGNGLKIAISYDSQDRATALYLPDGTSLAYHYNPAYLERVTLITNKGKTFTHHYTAYNLAGQLTDEKLVNGMHKRRVYDFVGRLSAIQSLPFTETITYDPVGNPLSRTLRTQTSKTEISYTFDALHQLTSETGREPHTYTYDALNNRTTKDDSPYSLNLLNQIDSTSTAQYSYDLNGNLIKRQDASGTTLLRYDALSRLIGVEHSGKKTTYVYDSSSRRLLKRDNKKETAYLYHGETELGAYQQGKPVSLRHLGLQQEAIAFELDGALFTPLHDSCGNLSRLYIDQIPIETTQMTAFGETRSPSISPWYYSGKRFDPETGYYYFGKRYYDPSTGRFITKDPLGFEDGLNLYAYVHNRPLTHHDPDGQFAFLIPIALSLAAEYAVPFAAVALQEAGYLTAAAFITGALQGYNGSFLEECPMADLDPAASFAGKALGALLSVANPRQGIKNCARTLASKEVSTVATKVVQKKATKWFNTTPKNAASGSIRKTEQIFEKSILNKSNASQNFSLDALSKAGQSMDRSGLTKAGRALDKHGNRPGSIFPKATGNAVSKNAQGQFVLEDILTDPLGTTKITPSGHIRVVDSSGRGTHFYPNGEFKGFITIIK